MSTIKTLVTDFTEKPIAVLALTADRGLAVRMVDPGTYTFSSIVPWGYSETDEAEFEDLTQVDAGDEVTVTLEDGDEPVVYYVRIERVGQLENLNIHYDRPNAGAQGPQGEQGEKGDKGDQGDTGAPGYPTAPVSGTWTLKSTDGVVAWVEDV